MAERTVLADDIDGTLEATRCEFTWEGVDYTIDLSGKNLLEFQDWQATARRFVRAAHVVERKRKRGASQATPGVDLAQLRKWAEANDITVPRVGRIPTATVKRYLSETSADE